MLEVYTRFLLKQKTNVKNKNKHTQKTTEQAQIPVLILRIFLIFWRMVQKLEINKNILLCKKTLVIEGQL
jgi:hypothetical protein